MRVLILVISDDSHTVYAENRRLWRETPRPSNVEVYFIERSPRAKEAVLEGDVLTVPGEENSPGIVRKTVEAFDYFLKSGHSYDWVVRTNLSSHYHIPRLLSFLETRPTTRYYGGARVCYGNIVYATGCGMYLTPDVCEILQTHRDALYSVGIIDDVDIGCILGEHGIVLEDLNSQYTDFTNRTDFSPEECRGFHFRLKQDGVDRSRVEPEARRRLMEILKNPAPQ